MPPPPLPLQLVPLTGSAYNHSGDPFTLCQSHRKGRPKTRIEAVAEVVMVVNDMVVIQALHSILLTLF